MAAKEKRFLDALEALFTGAEVDGDSGFVNLMRMKRQYFQSLQGPLLEKIDGRVERRDDFREELFDKLYTFFSRYFCESGSIYFRHLPAFAKIYERVYADGSDVALSWKTHMLYYVKSDVLVRSMPVELSEEGSPRKWRFYFDASQIKHKRNNEKREFVFAFSEVEKTTGDDPVLRLQVSYSEKGKKTKVDDILKQARKAELRVSEERLEQAFRVFRRQTEADYFINKDARGFLREQFDLWLHQYLFQEETIFEQKRLTQLQFLQETAHDIIDFIAQFEDELRRAWEKPKFVRNVNYVVTLDKLPDKTLKKITEHKGATAQIKEWRALSMVDDEFSMTDLFKGQKDLTDKNGTNGARKFLPLDTKHFKSLEIEILEALGNLDETLDGELAHSENWQALNTLQKRYKEKVKCIYIDPPFNTGFSEIIYMNSSKHSTWLTLMENRFEAVLDYQAEDRVFVVAIDENERERLGLLLSKIFPKDQKTAVTIIHNPRGIIGNNFSYMHEYVYFLIPEGKKVIGNRKIDENDIVWRGLRDNGGESLRTDARNCFYPIIVDKRTDQIVSFGDVCENDFHPDANVHKDNLIEIYPIDKHSIERKWRYARQSVEEIKDLLRVKIVDNIYNIQVGKNFGMYRTVWTDNRYDANEHGTKLLNNLIPNNDFTFPKSIWNVYDCIHMRVADDKEATILDYFAGSGTTAHAVINLNREDGGKRKYLLIEMGDYFHTVLLPRIKKVVYSKDWKDGKPASHEGSSHCLKYYALEQYEETLKNARYKDSEQLEMDSLKSPFEQYVFFGDDKLAHAVQFAKNGKLKINLKDLYKDIDIAESLSNILGKPIRRRATDEVVFADGTIEKINPAKMTEAEKQHFISLIKPYLWWGE